MRPEAPLVLVLHGLTGFQLAITCWACNSTGCARLGHSVALNWRGLLGRAQPAAARAITRCQRGRVQRGAPPAGAAALAPLLRGWATAGGNVLWQLGDESWREASGLQAAVAVSVLFAVGPLR